MLKYILLIRHSIFYVKEIFKKNRNMPINKLYFYGVDGVGGVGVVC